MKELLSRPPVRLALVLLLVAGLLWCLSLLEPVLTPFGIAFAIAYFLNPPVNALERFFEGDIAKSRLVRGRLHARTAAVGILIAAALVSLVLALLFLVPVLAHQVAEAVRRLPGYIQSARARLEPLYEKLNLQYPDQTEEWRQRIEEAAKTHGPELLLPVTRFFRGAFSSVLGFALAAIHVLVVPVFTAYLLFDMNRISLGIKDLVPYRFRPYVYSRFKEVDRLLAAFVRGQLTVCLILGTYYALALTVIGVPLGIVVGFGVGLLHMVPFVSAVVGLPSTLLLSWLDAPNPQRLMVIAGLFFLGHFAESNFISPRIVGHSLGLHAVVILLAVLTGGTLFGFLGVLLAVPTTAALSVFWADLRELYLRSEFYKGTAG
jgi:predicted PurR-regulated permease PerM